MARLNRFFSLPADPEALEAVLRARARRLRWVVAALLGVAVLAVVAGTPTAVVVYTTAGAVKGNAALLRRILAAASPAAAIPYLGVGDVPDVMGLAAKAALASAAAAWIRQPVFTPIGPMMAWSAFKDLSRYGRLVAASSVALRSLGLGDVGVTGAVAAAAALAAATLGLTALAAAQTWLTAKAQRALAAARGETPPTLVNALAGLIRRGIRAVREA